MDQTLRNPCCLILSHTHMWSSRKSCPRPEIRATFRGVPNSRSQLRGDELLCQRLGPPFLLCFVCFFGTPFAFFTSQANKYVFLLGVLISAKITAGWYSEFSFSGRIPVAGLIRRAERNLDPAVLPFG